MGVQNVLGVNYPYPDEGDEPWGVDHIAWATAVSDATNALQAEVDNINDVEIPALQAQINLSGEANTSSNSGAGLGLALAKVGVDLPFKSLVAGTGVGITSGADTLTINATSSGDVTGPVVSVDGNIAIYNGATGKVIKLSGVNIDPSDNVNIPGELTAATVAQSTANTISETVERPDGTNPGVRGIAISASSALVSESTTTPQDLAVTATVTVSASERPVFFGLTVDSDSGYIAIDTGTSTNPISCRIRMYRDGTEVYDANFTAPIAGGNDTFQIPPSSVWGIDTGATAGARAYTCTINLVNIGTSAACSVDNIKIVAYEL